MADIGTNYDLRCPLLKDCFTVFSEKKIRVKFISLGLESIEADFLEEYSNLTQLDLSENRIKHISPNAFKTGRLSDISLSQNDMQNISGIFANLPTLRKLDLRSNRLRDIPAGAFENTTGLKTLRLDRGAIQLSSLEFLEENFENLDSLFLQLNETGSNPGFDSLPALPSLKVLGRIHVQALHSGAKPICDF